MDLLVVAILVLFLLMLFVNPEKEGMAPHCEKGIVKQGELCNCKGIAVAPFECPKESFEMTGGPQRVPGDAPEDLTTYHHMTKPLSPYMYSLETAGGVLDTTDYNLGW